MKVFITQSNYIPWKGFFDALAYCDILVVYDEMQYTKRDWRNRNLIKTPSGLKWLSIPVQVKGKYYQKINETRTVDDAWKKSHLGLIETNYKEATCYDEMHSWLVDLYSGCESDFLTDINLYFIRKITAFLGIEIEVLRSRDFDLHDDRTQRLVNICKEVGATDYFSGPAARAYMEQSKFEESGINVHYWDYRNYPEYEQPHGAFVHEVSILDLLLSNGRDSAKYLLYK